MRVFGLIGYPLTHSFSQEFFTKKFHEEGISDAVYNFYPLLSIDELPSLIRQQKNLRGLNVTLPYKISVIDYLDEMDPEAAQTGAVNTILISSEGKMKGYNTDVYGFEYSLRPLLKPEHTKALILGTGGASKAVCRALDMLQIPYTIVSRNPSETMLSYDQLDKKIMREHQLIVQATPLGMYPGITEFPSIPYNLLNPSHLCYDLVYNPSESLFLLKARQSGARVKNGLQMLYLQAEKAWEIWNIKMNTDEAH